MFFLRLHFGKTLTLAVGTLSLGMLLSVSAPLVEADPWWYPMSMRPDVLQQGRSAEEGGFRDEGAQAASGVAVSGIGAASGIRAQIAASAVAGSSVAASIAPAHAEQPAQPTDQPDSNAK